MIKTNKITLAFAALLLLVSAKFISAQPISIDAKLDLKNNGSGTLELIYSAKNTDVKNYVVGNYAFAPKVIEKRFTSPNSKVDKVTFYKSKNDTSIYNALVNISFNDISKLYEAISFADIKTSFAQADGGVNFTWTFPNNTKAAAKISKLTFVATFQDKVSKSNGQKIEGNTVTWYREAKDLDPNKEIQLTASTGQGQQAGNKGNDKAADNKEQKSCGLFGFELPVLILIGYLFSMRKRS